MNPAVVDGALLEWEARLPAAITSDPLWRLDCYREALFLVDLLREDVAALGPSPSVAAVKGQLVTSVGSVAANIAVGYGRSTTADRVRFFSYAVGSAREAVIWYETVRSALPSDIVDDRVARLARLRRTLFGLLSRLRKKGGRKFDGW